MFNYVFSNPIVTHCTINGNNSGMVNIENSSPTVTNCTMSNNAEIGMVNSGSSPTVTNCIMSNNLNFGIANDLSSSPTVTNCTMSENYNGMQNTNSCNPTVTNSIFWGNTIEIFKTDDADNSSYPETIIIGRDSRFDHAAEISSLTGITNRTYDYESDSLVNVTIILGKDYQNFQPFNK